MSDRREQWFHFGPWVFSIDAAVALVDATPRTPQALNVNAWADAYGLTHLDDPHRTAINLISPAKGALDRLYAMSTDLHRPVLLGQLPMPDSPPAALLIDGVHRLYHAWRAHIPWLPAYLLTTDETDRIRRDTLLGPGGVSLPPST